MELIQKINQTLTASIFEVFEKMFFIFLEPIDDDGGLYDISTSIHFNGPMTGTMEVMFAKGLAEMMVVNMLGIEAKDISGRDEEDCAKEAINMICGNFLRKVDTSKVFDLTIPTFERKSGRVTETVPESGQPRAVLFFDADGNNFSVVLNIIKQNSTQEG